MSKVRMINDSSERKVLLQRNFYSRWKENQERSISSERIKPLPTENEDTMDYEYKMGNRKSRGKRKIEKNETLMNAAMKKHQVYLILLLIVFFLSLFMFSPLAFSNGLVVISPVGQQELTELDRLLKTLETFDHSQGEALSLELNDFVFKHKDEPVLRAAIEKKLLEFFLKPVTPEARIAVSKPLSLIASSESVRVLGAFLLDDRASDPARYVLERIPGKEADRALLQALDQASPAVLPGIISSLGQRRVQAAVPYFEKLLQKNPSPLITATILEALGNLNNPEVEKILAQYVKSGEEKIRLLAVDSLLRIAQREIKENSPEPARKISDLLLKAKLTAQEKMAAWRIKILSAGDKVQSEIQAALKAKDAEAHQAAIGFIPQLVSQSDIDSYLPLFSKFTENELIQVVAALSHYSTPKVREYLAGLAGQSPSMDVRTEDINSLGKIGDSSTVEFLLKKAAAAKGKEKAAARESLVVLRGRAVDEKILELLAEIPDQPVKNELLLAACERNIKESKDYFVKEAANPSADVALVSRGLRAFGDISLAEELLDIIFKTQDEAFQEELTGILAGWAKQSASPDARSTFFRNLLGKETQPEKQAIFISIIGKIGERNSLPLLRNYVKNQNPKIREAVIKTLSSWPEVEARDDLMLIARSSSDLKEKVLAIRGLVRLTASERYRRTEAVVESLKEIYSLCPRAEEKKLVLSALPDFPCEAGLTFCQSLMKDSEVGPEARTAAEKIVQRLRR